MQTKTIQPIHVLCFETRTSLKEILQYVRVEARRLYRDAVRNDLEITGPVYWIYQGADGQADTVFTLTIALPVTPPTHTINSPYQLKQLEAFECVSEDLYGNWDGLSNTYGSLFGEIMSRKLVPSGQNREIYLNMDFENPERNITEVQIGIVK
ncbi:GyrI-like domain-containing protein [Dyadobacter fermentans]|uniref:Transcription activator, effector binding n=1 Tax=Dyadobacter fermentans (strain ATCC 700827 / DSM 18053 / CIP 107007 / KCTC 52180 / NS114) TaxID=471854 RepID=C6VXT2_DYAFD|nr:GyrI-like domain-containing protein [Dyadobacter fermentans]ACT95115.1 transcription activator, effector binding [Dyadobacter fermentans DSM 18053]